MNPQTNRNIYEKQSFKKVQLQPCVMTPIVTDFIFSHLGKSVH
jgi:hypothetical protein